MTGTTQLLGTEIPIWGFSSTGDAGSATAPGPDPHGAPGRHGHGHGAQRPGPERVPEPARPARVGLHRRALGRRPDRGRRPRWYRVVHVQGGPSRHVPLRGGPHPRWGAPGRDGAGRSAGRAARGRHRPRAGVRRRRRRRAQRDRPRAQRPPRHLRHAHLRAPMAPGQRQGVPRDGADRHRPGPHGAAPLRQRGRPDAPDGVARHRPARGRP